MGLQEGILREFLKELTQLRTSGFANSWTASSCSADYDKQGRTADLASGSPLQNG